MIDTDIHSGLRLLRKMHPIHGNSGWSIIRIRLKLDAIPSTHTFKLMDRTTLDSILLLDQDRTFYRPALRILLTDFSAGIYYPRGATLGGSSQVNAMNYAWSPDSDWDYIANLTGDASWGHRHMRRHFMGVENCTYVPRGTPGHGFGGLLEVSAQFQAEQILVFDFLPL